MRNELVNVMVLPDFVKIVCSSQKGISMPLDSGRNVTGHAVSSHLSIANTCYDYGWIFSSHFSGTLVVRAFVVAMSDFVSANVSVQPPRKIYID